jgi:ABC-type spermidine/putrescine transport system permease subunit II
MIMKFQLRDGRLLIHAAVVSVLAFLILPAFIVIPMSFGPSQYLKFPPVGFSLVWYKEFIHSEAWLGSFWLSFQVASLTVVIATVVGTLAALAIVRGDFPGKAFLNGMIILPMVVPVIVLAIAVYGLYVKLGLVGTRTGLVCAHSVLAFPYVFLIMRSNLHGFDTNLELAAMNLGANRIRTFFLVTLPLILPGMMTSAIFAFIVSFDELVVANFISGIRATTLPKQMFDGIRLEVSPVVAAVSSILILFSIFTILLLQFLRKGEQRTAGSP